MATLKLEPEQVDDVIVQRLSELYFEMITAIDKPYLMFKENKEDDVKAIREFMKCIAEVYNYYTTEEHHL
jgi:hypothetical protein